MSNPRFGISITADDRTAKGARSAEKRLGDIGKRSGKANAETVRRAESAIGRSSRGILSTFTRIEQASANAIGGTGGRFGGGIVSRLSAVASVAETTGTGLGEAAASGGLLRATLGTVATGAAAVVGVLAGVAFATDKVVSGWARGVIGASNLANTIGVATRELQAFQAAGERVGIDKNTAGAAMAGVSDTLNDARFGKNANAAATLAYLGIPMKLNADGTVNTAAMLPAIADAMRRQNSFGARQIARNLGLGDAAVPMMRQGGAALKADMDDAMKHAAVVEDGDEAKARRWHRQRTRLGQLFERAGNRAGAWGADQAQGVLDGGTNGAVSVIDSGGRNILDGASQFARSVADRFVPAVNRLATAAPPVGNLNTSELARRIERYGEWHGGRSRQMARSPVGAVGVMQVMPGTARDTARKHGFRLDERRFRTDADYNRRIGDLHVGDLVRQLGTTNPAVVGAAYNAGATVVLDWLRGTNVSKNNPRHRRLPDPRQGASDAAFVAGIPGGGYQETHDYAARVSGVQPVKLHVAVEDQRVRARVVGRQSGPVVIQMLPRD